jgi:hypothetical protein
MATWKKVIVSGSNAELNQITASGGITATLSSGAQSNFVAYNSSTGQFSYASTGSFTAATASYITASNVYGPFGSNSILSASNAATASSTVGTLSAIGTGGISLSTAFNGSTGSTIALNGYAGFTSNGILKWNGSSFTNSSITDDGTTISTAASISAGGANSSLSGSFSGSFFGTLTGTASFATNANTASYVNALSQSVLISGSLSLALTGSASLTVEGNQFAQTYLSTAGAMVLNPGTGGVGMAGVNQYITLGYIYGQTAGTILTGSFTGSFKGDGSGLTGVPSSSFATNANTASYVLNAVSSSFATNASTASYVLNAVSASYATSALSSSYAGVAGNANSVSNAITNNTNNYLLTATGGGSINGESNLLFDGTLLTVAGNATITGDLTVAGTASFTNTDNLTIRDKFILINSGSSTLADSGWITQYNSSGQGSAFYLEATSAGTYGRFAVAYDVLGTATSVTADEFVVTAKVNQSAPTTQTPTWGGNSTNGQGNMWLTSTGDIYIWA